LLENSTVWFLLDVWTKPKWPKYSM
jgi:hypothetical protein